MSKIIEQLSSCTVQLVAVKSTLPPINLLTVLIVWLRFASRVRVSRERRRGFLQES